MEYPSQKNKTKKFWLKFLAERALTQNEQLFDRISMLSIFMNLIIYQLNYNQHWFFKPISKSLDLVFIVSNLYLFWKRYQRAKK